MSADARLDEYDRNEWWDVCRAILPEMTREQFDKAWEEFQQLKAEHERRKELQ